MTIFKESSAAQPIVAEVEVKFRRTLLTGIDGRLVQLTEIRQSMNYNIFIHIIIEQLYSHGSSMYVSSIGSGNHCPASQHVVLNSPEGMNPLSQLYVACDPTSVVV